MTRDDDELLPLLPEDEEHDLVLALRAAWAPEELDPAKHEAMLALVLEDPLAPPTEDEIAESERLRQALEGQGEHPYADLARALAAAEKPEAIAPGSAERMVERATGPASAARRGNVVYVVFGAAAATLALAASIALFVGPIARAPESGAMASRLQDLAVSRSTAAMFNEKFETGATTDRVDKIAVARARELRSNRYAMWGVR